MTTRNRFVSKSLDEQAAAHKNEVAELERKHKKAKRMLQEAAAKISDLEAQIANLHQQPESAEAPKKPARHRETVVAQTDFDIFKT